MVEPISLGQVLACRQKGNIVMISFAKVYCFRHFIGVLNPGSTQNDNDIRCIKRSKTYIGVFFCYYACFTVWVK